MFLSRSPAAAGHIAQAEAENLIAGYATHPQNKHLRDPEAQKWMGQYLAQTMPDGRRYGDHLAESVPDMRQRLAIVCQVYE